MSKRAPAVTPPSDFDPITLNHWLWFKYKCHESTFTEFERLFQEIIKRAHKQFMQIKPYGNIGDRKCDGLLIGNDDVTIFQVYAPDELKLAELKAKINEDLDLAVEHWRELLQAWTFVYNVRRGVAADVATEILRKKQQYQQIAIDCMSNDQLWDIARNDLSLQQRAEVLGAPSGYEYLFLSPGATNSEVRELLDKSWSVIIQDTMSPVNLGSILPALEPEVPFGAPFYIRPSVNELGWRESAEYQQTRVQELLQRTGDVLPRYAVFSFAHIPLAVHLGFLLSDRLEV
jgi:hypothetical protein